MKDIKTGLSKRENEIEDFRIGNFWAWHIKEDREASFKEARRELIFRGSLLPPFSLHHFLNEDEAQIVIDNYNAGPENEFAKGWIISNIWRCSCCVYARMPSMHNITYCNFRNCWWIGNFSTSRIGTQVCIYSRIIIFNLVGNEKHQQSKLLHDGKELVSF